MKKWMIPCAMVLMLIFGTSLTAEAGGPQAKPGLFFSHENLTIAAPASTGTLNFDEAGNVNPNPLLVAGGPTSPYLFGKKKKRKSRLLAVGVVLGGPVNLGGRALLKIGRFGVAADAAFKKIRLDTGPRIGILALKVDGRIYGKGFLARLMHPYLFGGATIQHGDFDSEIAESVIQGDAGLGLGIRLGRLEIGGQAGVLIPLRRADNYQPGLNVFANLSAMFWIL